MSAPSVGVSSASMSTFGGMYTEDDLSTIEARQRREEEAEEKGEEVDEIVQELPIYLSHPNEGQILYQVQSPLRSVERGGEGGCGREFAHITPTRTHSNQTTTKNTHMHF